MGDRREKDRAGRPGGVVCNKCGRRGPHFCGQGWSTFLEPEDQGLFDLCDAIEEASPRGRFEPLEPDDLEREEQSTGLERWGVRTDGQGRESDPGGAIVSAAVVALAVLAALAGFLAWVLG